MRFLKKIKFFKVAAIGIFTIFMGLMLLVAVVGHTRRSGHTGLDMGKIQQLRAQASVVSDEKKP